jgi:hypothetical protein
VGIEDFMSENIIFSDDKLELIRNGQVLGSYLKQNDEFQVFSDDELEIIRNGNLLYEESDETEYP